MIEQLELGNNISHIDYEPHRFNYSVFNQNLNCYQHLLNCIIFHFNRIEMKVEYLSCPPSGAVYVNIHKDIFNNLLLKNHSVIRYLKRKIKTISIESGKLDASHSELVKIEDFFHEIDNITEVTINISVDNEEEKRLTLDSIIDILSKVIKLSENCNLIVQLKLNNLKNCITKIF